MTALLREHVLLAVDLLEIRGERATTEAIARHVEDGNLRVWCALALLRDAKLVGWVQDRNEWSVTEAGRRHTRNGGKR